MQHTGGNTSPSGSCVWCGPELFRRLRGEGDRTVPHAVEVRACDDHEVQTASVQRLPLSGAARALRAFHITIAGVDLAALGYIWACGVTGRRGRLLTASIAALLVEGGALVVGRGDCPLGPLQAKVGDPTPLFELALPTRAAKAAVPILVVVSLAGIAVVVVRSGVSTSTVRGGGCRGRIRRSRRPPVGRRHRSSSTTTR